MVSGHVINYFTFNKFTLWWMFFFSTNCPKRYQQMGIWKWMVMKFISYYSHLVLYRLILPIVPVSMWDKRQWIGRVISCKFHATARLQAFIMTEKCEMGSMIKQGKEYSVRFLHASFNKYVKIKTKLTSFCTTSMPKIHLLKIIWGEGRQKGYGWGQTQWFALESVVNNRKNTWA